MFLFIFFSFETLIIFSHLAILDWVWGWELRTLSWKLFISFAILCNNAILFHSLTVLFVCFTTWYRYLYRGGVEAEGGETRDRNILPLPPTSLDRQCIVGARCIIDLIVCLGLKRQVRLLAVIKEVKNAST